jgi:protocatechuate 3,4-dioxygenase alpha subunit
LTPFQTVGPFLRLGLRVEPGNPPAAGRRITIRGRLLDGQRQGIPDGVLEWWHPSFACIQRVLTQEDGGFVLETVKPSRVPGPDDHEQASHLAVRVLGRGILTQYNTRMYFGDESSDDSHDPILCLVPEHRRHTLIASLSAPDQYQFNVIVQGDGETVFFDI